MTTGEGTSIGDPADALRQSLEDALVVDEIEIESVVVMPKNELALVYLSLPPELTEGDRLHIEVRIRKTLIGIDAAAEGGLTLVPVFPRSS